MGFTLFGLTGGIACGKSVVAAFLGERALPVVDADVLAREVVAPGTPGLARIVERFGPGVLDGKGALDRKALAEIVFRDPGSRRDLERITHPLIRARTLERAQALHHHGHPLAAYEAALLVENGLAEAFRPLVVVTAALETQVRRLMERDAVTEAHARERIGAQKPLVDKVAVADHVIDTDGSFARVREDTDGMLAEICRSCSVDPRRYGLPG